VLALGRTPQQIRRSSNDRHRIRRKTITGVSEGWQAHEHPQEALSVQGQTNSIQIPSLQELFGSFKVVSDDWEVRFEADLRETQAALQRAAGQISK
jgi:hypothetical protein